MKSSTPVKFCSMVSRISIVFECLCQYLSTQDQDLCNQQWCIQISTFKVLLLMASLQTLSLSHLTISLYSTIPRFRYFSIKYLKKIYDSQIGKPALSKCNTQKGSNRIDRNKASSGTKEVIIGSRQSLCHCANDRR